MAAWSFSKVARVYVLSLLPGLSALAEVIGRNVGERLVARISADQIFPWALVPRTPKIQQIVEYAVFTALLAIVFMCVAILGRRGHRALGMTGAQALSVISCLAGTFLAPFVFTRHETAYVWLVVAGILPYYYWRMLPREESDRTGSSPINRIAPRITPGHGAGLVLIVLVAVLYKTAWSPELRFSNDYAELPEYTRFSSGDVVENNHFIKENRIARAVRLDPCAADALSGICIPMPRSLFGSPREAAVMFPLGSGLRYDWDREKLIGYRSPSKNECLLISALLNSPVATCPLSAFQTGPTNGASFDPYASRVGEFIEINRALLDSQDQLGRFFFHHAYFYLPIVNINAAVEGAAALPTQYGYGLSRTFANLLDMMGSSRFDNYFRLYWAGPAVYLLLGCVFIALLVRRIELSIAWVGLVIALLPFQSVEGLRMAPGFNPLRHLPDLLCFLAVGLHARQATLITGLLKAFSIALLCWWNREFGAFMLAGAIAWAVLAIVRIPDQRRKLVAQLTLEVLSGALVLALVTRSDRAGSELAFYNLLGVGTPQTQWGEIAAYSALWSLLLGAAAWLRYSIASESRHLLDVAGAGLCYAAFCAVYGLWNPSPAHFSVVWICASLPLICFLGWFIANMGRMLQLSSQWFADYVAVSFSILAVTASVAAVILTEGYFQRLFQQHQVFDWQFPGIAGKTTADPRPVSESLDLLRAIQPSGPLVLISRHDVLLHTASGRSNRLPFVDLPSALVSWSMIDAIASRIDAVKPEVIFMDREIFTVKDWELRNESFDFMSKDPVSVGYRKSGQQSVRMNTKLQPAASVDRGKGEPLDSVPANIHRLGHLSALSALGRRVSECYRPGAAGGLIQAWHRKCP